jgi:hypothetical protein
MEMGRSAVEGAIAFAAEVGVDERVLVSGVEALSRFEYVEFVGGVGVGVKQGFEVEVRDAAFILGGRQSAELSFCRASRAAFMLSRGFRRWYCLIRSGECTCAAGSHVLSLSGYPFHLRRYCNRFVRL